MQTKINKLREVLEHEALLQTESAEEFSARATKCDCQDNPEGFNFNDRLANDCFIKAKRFKEGIALMDDCLKLLEAFDKSCQKLADVCEAHSFESDDLPMSKEEWKEVFLND